MWTSIISSLCGAIIGFFLGPVIRHWWLSPRIQIAKQDEIEHEKGIRYHTLAITNEGRQAAGECTAFITLKGINNDDVVVTARKQLLMPDVFRSRKVMENRIVPWIVSGRSSSREPINSKATIRLQLYRVLLGDGGSPDMIQLATEYGWDPILISLRPKTTPYEGKIVITSANAHPQEISFELATAEDDVHFFQK